MGNQIVQNCGMSLVWKRKNICVLFAAGIGLMMLFFLYTLNIQVSSHALKKSKIVLVQNSNHLSHSAYLPEILGKTQMPKTNERVQEENSSRFLSPYINSKFQFNLPYYENSYTILYYGAPDWFKEWTVSFDMKQCLEFTNCRQSFDISQISKSHAVVFNLPHFTLNNNKPPVEQRSPNQVWVFFTLESPLHINPDYRSPVWHDVFNWSWTYHLNADIFHPYGMLIKKESVPFRNYSDIFRKKTKFAAWAVSNCFAPSKRNEFVDILKRYVNVNIYGRCGEQAPANLDSVISANYKFYLAFENSFCDDYMTEKFFQYYKLDVIVVVRGSLKHQDYLPSGSFIETANFTSITALAKYMKELGENEEKYVSYLKVKDKFKVYEREDVFKDAICKVCEKLNKIDENKRTYDDAIKWLGQCYDANDLKENNSTYDLSAGAVSNKTKV